MLGIGVVAGVWASFLTVLRYVGAAILVLMGVQLVRRAEAAGLAVTAGGLGRESGWAAFSAGLMVIAGNPKAILFYMGVLPGFFDFRTLTPLDMALICLVSVLVPFLGNLGWAALFARARRWLADPVAMRRTHVAAGAGAGGGGGGDCGGVRGWRARRGFAHPRLGLSKFARGGRTVVSWRGALRRVRFSRNYPFAFNPERSTRGKFMPDKYESYAELRASEAPDAFEITVFDRNTPAVIVAPHGGKIELGTTEITAAMAQDIFSAYAFTGKKASDNSDLHITSTKFDEPMALALVSRSEYCVAIHGAQRRGSGRVSRGAARGAEGAAARPSDGGGVRTCRPQRSGFAGNGSAATSATVARRAPASSSRSRAGFGTR